MAVEQTQNTMTFSTFLSSRPDIRLTTDVGHDPSTDVLIVNSTKLKHLTSEGPKLVNNPYFMAVWLDLQPDVKLLSLMLADWKKAELKASGISWQGSSIGVSQALHIDAQYLLFTEIRGQKKELFSMCFLASAHRIPKALFGSRGFLELPQQSDETISGHIDDVLSIQRALVDCYVDEGENPEIAPFAVHVTCLESF